MKKSGLKIVMVGAGNLAWQLAPALENAGCQITSVYSHTLENARALAAKLQNATATATPDFRNEAADLYIIAIKDAALPELLCVARFPENSVVAHTSGTQPLQVFEEIKGIRGAVFYPLQTFSKNTPVSFQNIPVCLETADENAMLLLKKIAHNLSEQVYEIGSGERKILHLAAVFACNFTNHLLGISAEILKQHNLPFQLLKPLVEQTIQKAFAHEPFSVQTGPAIRHDETTLQAQLKLLEKEPLNHQIYTLLTRSIQQHS